MRVVGQGSQTVARRIPMRIPGLTGANHVCVISAEIRYTRETTVTWIHYIMIIIFYCDARRFDVPLHEVRTRRIKYLSTVPNSFGCNVVHEDEWCVSIKQTSGTRVNVTSVMTCIRARYRTQSNATAAVAGSRLSVQPLVSHVVCQHALPTTIKDIMSLDDRLTRGRETSFIPHTHGKRHLERMRNYRTRSVFIARRVISFSCSSFLCCFL